jgi:hypothetical protein
LKLSGIHRAFARLAGFSKFEDLIDRFVRPKRLVDATLAGCKTEQRRDGASASRISRAR